MKPVNRFFEIVPKIVLTGSKVAVKIRGLQSHCRFHDEFEYEVSYYPCERFSPFSEYKYQDKLKLKPVDGILAFEQEFKGEQEHIFEICKIHENRSENICKLCVYSVEKDLYTRKPYKGDMHMHSYYSDGKESPGFVAASCRKIGMDFMAVTDHRLYKPSIEAQEDFKKLSLDMLICRGEEVHPVNNPVHMINFGGSFSINELINDNREAYFKEVSVYENNLTEIADKDARYQCASCLWVFDKIREAHGLGIFCHPYWLVREGYYISDTVTSYMLEKQPYDAYELIGGYFRHEADSNTLQVARYNEERAKGRKLPIVGVSDAHGCEGRDLFGWYYTIVFSQALEFDSIKNNIKDLYSVAVEALPNETARAYGPFRLVKYALFLMREVLPLHDELCFDEGRLMIRYLEGDNNAAERLMSLKSQISGLYDRIWGK